MWRSHYKTINAATAEDMPWDALPLPLHLPCLPAGGVMNWSPWKLPKSDPMSGREKAAQSGWLAEDRVANLILDSE